MTSALHKVRHAQHSQVWWANYISVWYTFI